jgi:hypothetical protein
MKKVLFAAALSMLVSCGPNVPSESEVERLLKSMRFVRHPNGLCFAVTSQPVSGGFTIRGFSQVDKSACGPERQYQ